MARKVSYRIAGMDSADEITAHTPVPWPVVVLLSA